MSAWVGSDNSDASQGFGGGGRLCDAMRLVEVRGGCMDVKPGWRDERWWTERVNSVVGGCKEPDAGINCPGLCGRRRGR